MNRIALRTIAALLSLPTAGAVEDSHRGQLGHGSGLSTLEEKVYPFNPVTVTWFVTSGTAAYDEVTPVPAVKAADANGDRTVTVEEMRAAYPDAALKTADMNLSISHSVVPAAHVFGCNDCHGRNGWVLDWQELGYPKDPARQTVGGRRR